MFGYKKIIVEWIHATKCIEVKDKQLMLGFTPRARTNKIKVFHLSDNGSLVG